MKVTIVRLLIIICLFVVFKYIAKWDDTFSLLAAYAVEYTFEPWVMSKT